MSGTKYYKYSTKKDSYIITDLETGEQIIESMKDIYKNAKRLNKVYGNYKLKSKARSKRFKEKEK